MTELDARGIDYRKLNERLRGASGEALIKNCLGQRFIAAGFSEKSIEIEGIPGNALGAYLNGARITVHGNAQDAVGDTMNDGRIVIGGSVGDAAGYAMRGGEIFVRGDAGYRAGIHMKEYKEKCPVMIIGGSCGSFLGEYQAGGIIIVLGLGGRELVGNFPCTGMHGGRVYLRAKPENMRLAPGVTASEATEADIGIIERYAKEYCDYFGADIKSVMNSLFTKVEPDCKNPYKQMYAAN